MYKLCFALGAVLGIATAAGADNCTARSRVYYPTNYTYGYGYPGYNQGYNYGYNDYKTYDYKEVVRVKEVVIPSFAIVPLYGAYYTPPAAPPAPATNPAPAPAVPAPAAAPAMPAMPQKAPCAEVDGRVKALETRLDQLITALQAQQAGKPAGPAVLPAAATPAPAANAAPSVPAGPVVAAPAAAGPHPALAVLKNRCAACHAPGTAAKEGGDFTMFDAAGALAALTDRQWGKIGTKLARGTMPPKKNSAGQDLPQLSEQEYAQVVDLLDTRK